MSRDKGLKQNLINLFVFVVMGVSIIAIASSNSAFVVISLMLSFVFLLLYCITNLAKNFVLAIMYICIFTFLASSVIGRFIFNRNDYMYGLTSGQFCMSCALIIISIYAMFCGYNAKKKYKLVIQKGNIAFFDDKFFLIERVQKISFCLFLLSTLSLLIFSIPKMIYALRNGYLSLYTNYSGSGWLSRLSFMSSASFCIGVASTSKKKRLLAYIIIGFINPIITFIQGERGTLVTYAFFLAYYYFTYDNWTEKDSNTNNKKTLNLILLGLIVVTVFLPFLYNYGLTRLGESSEVHGVNSILNFFDSQGGSFRVIGASVKYKGDLPQKWYSFGSIIDRFSDVSYGIQNEQRAMMAHSFADVITFKEEKWSYLSGYGMGSSYIAEIYYDFGMFGLIIVNYFLGRLIKVFSEYENVNIFKKSILFLVFQNMIIMPRGAFLRPIDVLLSSSTIFIYIIVFGLSRVRYKIVN